MEDTLNKNVELKITDIAYEGKGVGKREGYVYFIPKTAIGDAIEVEITKTRKNFSEGIVSRIIEPSADRIKPSCRYFSECGGCHYMHLSYKNQLEIKKRHVMEAFKKIGKIDDPFIEDIMPSPSVLGYRNKAVFHVSEGMIGYVSSDKNRIIDVENCPICDEEINSMLTLLRQSPVRRDLRIKNIALRTTRSPKGMAIIFCVEESMPDELRALADELNKKTAVSLFETISPQDSTLVFGESLSLIAGKPVLVESLAGCTFELSPLSFFQVNTEQAQTIIESVKKNLENMNEDQDILDLYCGVGLFSIPLSEMTKSVLAIDYSRQSIRDAKRNKEINNAQNVKFLQGMAREETDRLIEEGIKFYTVVLDPPRQGADKKLLYNISKLDAKKIIYISCSPPTLARDLGILKGLGFKLVKTTPVDMFPQTYHIESVSVIEKI